MTTSENVKGIQIQIGGDTTPLYNALNEASKKTKELESDLVALNKSLKTDPKNVELLQKKFDTLGGIVESCTKEVDILRKGLSSAELKFKQGEITEEQFKEIAKSTEQAEKKLKYYQEQFDNFKDSEAKLIDVREEIDKLAKEHDDLSTAFGEYTTQLSNTDYQTQPAKWQEIKQKVDDTRDALEQNISRWMRLLAKPMQSSKRWNKHPPECRPSLMHQEMPQVEWEILDQRKQPLKALLQNFRMVFP